MRPAHLLLAILSSAAVSSATIVAADGELLWSEEFEVDGAPDSASWTYDLGDLGVNQELQIYNNAPENVRVEDGHLILTARRRSNGVITSGRIKTQGKVQFQYGSVEARIRIPDLADGLWPAFWTLGADIDQVGWPRCGEIDILEMGAGDAIADGVVNRRVYSTVHWDIDGQYASYGLNLTTDEDLDDGFHIWRMEWTPFTIRTLVDGVPIWVIDISDPEAFSGQEFHAPHFFIANLAVGGNFTGIFNPAGITAALPAEYRIDYIRLFDNGHTILSGSGIAEPCPEDLDGDGRITAADLGVMLGAWGTNDPSADVNDDGIVDAADLGVILGAWGACP